MAKGRDETADSSAAAGEGAGRAGESSEAVAEGGQRAGQPAGGSSSWADLDFVRGLIEVVDASGIDSLEITRGGTRVKISKTPPSAVGPSYFGPAPYPTALSAGATPGVSGTPGGNAGAASGGAAAGGVSASESAGAPVVAGAGAEGGGKGAGLTDVKSPMVGTFYRAPAPEAPPYVEVGTRVSKGQTLCILEAMKLMNELESEVEGVVRQVLVENAEPVEYGQVLFRIDPDG